VPLVILITPCLVKPVSPWRTGTHGKVLSAIASNGSAKSHEVGAPNCHLESPPQIWASHQSAPRKRPNLQSFTCIPPTPHQVKLTNFSAGEANPGTPGQRSPHHGIFETIAIQLRLHLQAPGCNSLWMLFAATSPGHSHKATAALLCLKFSVSRAGGSRRTETRKRAGTVPAVDPAFGLDQHAGSI